MRTRSRLAALFGAALLVVAVAAPAWAYDITDDVTVNQSISVSGLPATVHYSNGGGLNVGDTSPIKTVNALVTSNAVWYGTLSATPLTGPGGTIPESTRQVRVSTDTVAVTFAPGYAGNFKPSDDPRFDGVQTLVQGAAGAGLLVQTELQLGPIPAGTQPGTYTGTLSWFFGTGNPGF